jgi:YHS domain-containing protein
MLAVSVFATAQDKPAATAPATPAAPTTKPAAVANTKCPVSGDAVDAKAKTAAYQGKTIGFCCDDCVEPFNKNPEKYAKNIK